MAKNTKKAATSRPKKAAKKAVKKKIPTYNPSPFTPVFGGGSSSFGMGK